jgi:hypothetical protein
MAKRTYTIEFRDDVDDRIIKADTFSWDEVSYNTQSTSTAVRFYKTKAPACSHESLSTPRMVAVFNGKDVLSVREN